MKENAKFIILGACIIVSVFVYVLGTRYKAVSVAGGGGFSGSVVIYDQFTGIRQ